MQQPDNIHRPSPGPVSASASAAPRMGAPRLHREHASRWLAASMLAALAALPATTFAQPAAAPPPPTGPTVLPTLIGEQDVELRARFVWQWKSGDELVLLFRGGFELSMGNRQMSADNAVVWIDARRDADSNRKYFELTVYLSENAEIVEPGGTTTRDSSLLVTDLRTFGRITKYHDAHAPQDLSTSSFYQRALRDRERVVASRGAPRAEPPAAPTTEDRGAEIARPDRVKPERTAPRRTIRYEIGNIEPGTTPTGERVFVLTGGVYFSQSGGPNSPAVELTADRAVIFAADASGGPFGSPSPSSQPTSAPANGETPTETPERGGLVPGARLPQAPTAAERSGVGGQIRAVYLEGDVLATEGERMIRADRLYYDFELNRALILDAVLRFPVPDRNVPIYVRADEIRQLSAREFTARHAKITTSEFYSPHYHMGVEQLKITDETIREARGGASGPLTASYQMRDATFNIQGLPLSYWPYAEGKLSQGETALRSFQTGFTRDFGFEFTTSWYLFTLLGIEAPQGYDATLEIPIYFERGPGIAVNLDYLREDYFGLMRSYYINDGGEDDLGPVRDSTPPNPNRGRFLYRHKQFLPRDWEMNLEFSYASDPGFLETYERSEWFESKEQETVIYFKRARDTEAVTLFANWRLLDFTTQTEHLPEGTYRRIGDTLGPFVFYNESRTGMVRYRPDDRRLFNQRRVDNTAQTGLVYRGDVREEAELPLKLGPLAVVPFSSVRGQYWDSAPNRSGGLWRGLGVYGVRGSMPVARVYDNIHSDLFDIDRIRHIVMPHFAAWWSHSNARSSDITPFDEGVETIDDFYGFLLGVRQIWQTKRGAGENRRSVDLLTLNTEIGIFGKADPNELTNGYVNPVRPEDSRSRNYFGVDAIYRLSDSTSLLWDMNLDLNDRNLDRNDISLAVERTPRLSYVVGTRYAHDIDYDLFGGGFNYRISQKHIIAYRTYFDLSAGNVGEMAFTYIRKLPRWYIAFNVEYDQAFDDFSITMALWPEGAPNFALGSRRFTGLATSTGIRP